VTPPSGAATGMQGDVGAGRYRGRMSDEHIEAAAARAQHYARTDPPAPPRGDVLERSAVGDFAYQVGVELVAGAGVAGLVAGAKIIADKVTGDKGASGGNGDQGQGGEQS
jgi:hypothetical protein